MKTLCGVALLAAMAGGASAEISVETAQFAGYINVNFATGETTYSDSPITTRATTQYTNTASAANFGFSSTDLNSTWGDDTYGVGTGGLVTSQQYTVFNSGSSAGSLLTCTVQLLYRDVNTEAAFAGFNGNINFGLTGLAKGFYSVVTFTGLDGLGMVVPKNVMLTQQVTAKTGLASRLGIASLNPPTVGTSFDDMYISSTTVGAPGWYTVASGPANPGYQIDVIPAPASLALMGMGGLIAGRRRR